MKKLTLSTFFIFLIVFSINIKAEDRAAKKAYDRFAAFYNAGDFVNAEKCLLLEFNNKKKLSESYLLSLYNNLGATNTQLGNYSKALEYYTKSEASIISKQKYVLDLASIYINIAIIFEYLKSYSSSLAYYEKGTRIYLNVKKPDINVLKNISTAYLNVGIIYYETEDYETALIFLRKSATLKQNNRLAGSAFVFLNIAKSYFKLNNFDEADKFFHLSIESAIKESGNSNFRLADIYFGYGLFQRFLGRNAKAIDLHKKALYICLKNYGEKHALVSLSFKHIGDDYLKQNTNDSALYYYQKALIAIGKDFYSTDIFTNPSIDSSLFDIRLLDNLKSKAQALELYAAEQEDPKVKLKCMNKSFETVDLALQLIDRIRNNFMSEESRIYLAENEKETYLFATHLAFSLYSTTHDKSMGYKMYSIAQKAKAAILRNAITGNELLYSSAIPDSLREKLNRLSGNIAAYNNLILEENRKTSPDSNKITLWKDALFDMNREKEKVTGEMERVFPQYHDLIRKTEPVPLEQIQKHLKNYETIVDYLLSNQYSGGKRRLYIFLISNDNLNFREKWLDSLFVKNAEVIRKTVNPSIVSGPATNNFIVYTGALNYMYLNLIKPVEDLFKGNKLIIIPDEEIGWLTFDAFLKNKPASDQTDYEGLHFLINDFTFSYGYSSSLIFSKNRNVKKGTRVFAFSPQYLNISLHGNAVSSLQGAGAEISSIFKRFGGKNFIGSEATKENFMSALSDSAIFHLAMHSMSDSLNSKYSCLMFDTHNQSPEGGKLYNYEISLARVKSPMVVLSACNSGTGTLYYGEGLMSLARGFTLAGASSVIKTAWEINDESSASIIKQFYYHLSKGKEKNEAMRLSKLEYLKESPPSFKDPYYWAAYEVLGDNAPVARDNSAILIVVILVVVVSAGLALFYFKPRRIFAERSR